MKILAAPDLPAKLQTLTDNPTVLDGLRDALHRLSDSSTRTHGDHIVASDRGVYVIRAGTLRLFYTVNRDEDYILLLDVVPISASSRDAMPTWSDNVEFVGWDDLAKRLLVFAERRLRSYRWQGVPGELPPGGKTAEDYVYDAIEAFLSGRRRFAANQTTLFAFLCGVISSEIDHDAATIENRVTTKEASAEVGQPATETFRGHSVEEEVIARELMQKFIEAIPDKQLRAYVELLASQPRQPAAEYAETLGVTPLVIRNLERRLRRLRQKWHASGKARSAPERQDAAISDKDAVHALSSDAEAATAAASALDMRSEELDEELRRLGIDARETIEAVGALETRK